MCLFTLNLSQKRPLPSYIFVVIYFVFFLVLHGYQNHPLITPTFTQVNPICNGDVLGPLPTTLDNNITGTWSPAIDNTLTTTYTFTPDITQPGQACAINQPMTITVNLVITPTFTQVNPICSGDVLGPLPTTSNNGITET
tara:strand:+ start:89 stop:508 length:420 start_codon:yes stop_codon:yes gene_type:complete